jgi:hypothetical protein
MVPTRDGRPDVPQGFAVWAPPPRPPALAMLSFHHACRKAAQSGVSTLEGCSRRQNPGNQLGFPWSGSCRHRETPNGRGAALRWLVEESPTRGIESASRGKISPCNRWIGRLIEVHPGHRVHGPQRYEGRWGRSSCASGSRARSWRSGFWGPYRRGWWCDVRFSAFLRRDAAGASSATKKCGGERSCGRSETRWSGWH